MASQNEIRILISADGSAAVNSLGGVSSAINRLSNETNLANTSMSSALSGISRGFMTLTALIGSAMAGLYAFKKALQPMEDYQQNIAQMTALTITFMDKTKNMSMAEQYQKAKTYAQSLVPVLEQIAAKTLLSAQETTELTTALMKQGVFLDINNEKAKQGFIALSNAIAIMTQGQNRSIQLQQEVRAMMEGNNVAGATLLNMLRAQNPAIEENIKKWRQEGTVLENLAVYLKGFNAVSGDLEMTWGSLSTTIQSTIDNLLRGGLKTAYDETMKFLSDMNKRLYENSDAIKSELAGAWHTVKSVIESVLSIAKPLWDLLKPVISMIAEGLLIIANTILPIVAEKIGAVVDFVKALMSSISKIFQTAVALIQGDMGTVNEIFKGWAKDGEEMSKAWGKIFSKDLGADISKRYNEFIEARQKAIAKTKQQDVEAMKGEKRPDYQTISQLAKARVSELEAELNGIKRLYDIEKLYAQDRLDALEDTYKRMSITDREYFDSKKQLIEQNLQLEGDLIISTAKAIYSKYEAEIASIRAEALAQGKSSDTTAKEAEALKKRNEALNQLMVQGTQSYLTYVKQMRNIDTQDLLNNLNKQLIAIEHRYTMEKIHSTSVLDAADDAIETQKTIHQNLYDDLEITASEYYKNILILQDQSTNNKIQRLQQEYEFEIQKIMDIAKAKAEAGGLSDKDAQDLTNKALQLEAKYQADRTRLIRESAKEREKIERDYAKATKSFMEGIIDGAKEYYKQIEFTADRGRVIFLDIAKNIEDTLVKMFDKPKDAMKDLLSYFGLMLKRMVVQALANPIIVPISAMISGGIGSLFGASTAHAGSMVGQAGSLYSMGSGLGIVPPINLFGQGGIGGWFNGLFGSGYGSGLTYTHIPVSDMQYLDAFGSITPQQAQAMGYTGLTPLGYLASGAGLLFGGYNMFRGIQRGNMFQAGLGGLGAGIGGASLINALAGSAIINPIIGGVALALGGIIGSIFGSNKKEPSFSFMYNPTGQNQYWDRTTYSQGAYGISTYAYDMPAEQQRQMVAGYKAFMEGIKAIFERSGRKDIAEGFSKYGTGVTAPIHVEGKTPEEIEKAMKIAWGTTVGTIIEQTDKVLFEKINKLQMPGQALGEVLTDIFIATEKFATSGLKFDDHINLMVNNIETLQKYMSKDDTLGSVYSRFADIGRLFTTDFKKLYDEIEFGTDTYKQAMNKLRDNIKKELSSLSGLSGQDAAEKLKQISQMSADYYESIIAYLHNVKKLSQDIATSSQSLIESMEWDTLDANQRISRVNARIDNQIWEIIKAMGLTQEDINNLMNRFKAEDVINFLKEQGPAKMIEQLMEMGFKIDVDAEKIQSSWAKFTELMRQGWSLMSDDMKPQALENAKTWIEQIRNLTTTLLDFAVSDVEGGIQDLQGEIEKTDLGNIVSGLKKLSEESRVSSNAVSGLTGALSNLTETAKKLIDNTEKTKSVATGAIIETQTLLKSISRPMGPYPTTPTNPTNPDYPITPITPEFPITGISRERIKELFRLLEIMNIANNFTEYISFKNKIDEMAIEDIQTVFINFLSNQSLPKKIRDIAYQGLYGTRPYDDTGTTELKWTWDMANQVMNFVKSIGGKMTTKDWSGIETDEKELWQIKEVINKILQQDIPEYIKNIGRLALEGSVIDMREFVEFSQKINEFYKSLIPKDELDRINKSKISDLMQQLGTSYEKWKEDARKAIESGTLSKEQLQRWLELGELLKGVDEQVLKLKDSWKNFGNSLRDTIKSLTMSNANPADIYTRLDISKSEVERIRRLYLSASGEDKIKYADEYSKALQEYLRLSQEAYQKPSPEYQRIYDMIIQELTRLAQEAEFNSENMNTLTQQVVANTDKTAQYIEKLYDFFTKAPAFADGGYVARPTFALIGERGGEYVIPERKMLEMKGGVTIAPTINITANGSDIDEKEIVDLVMEKIERSVRYGVLSKI